MENSSFLNSSLENTSLEKSLVEKPTMKFYKCICMKYSKCLVTFDGPIMNPPQIASFGVWAANSLPYEIMMSLEPCAKPTMAIFEWFSPNIILLIWCEWIQQCTNPIYKISINYYQFSINPIPTVEYYNYKQNILLLWGLQEYQNISVSTGFQIEKLRYIIKVLKSSEWLKNFFLWI